MKKIEFFQFAVLPAILCATLFFACSDEFPEIDFASLAKGSDYEYCMFKDDGLCLKGPFKVCSAGGELSDRCSYYGSATDSRDNKTYKTVTIGTQIWMAGNLNYNTNDSKCYENKDENCAKYGRLYNWKTAMNHSEVDNTKEVDNTNNVQGVCPADWHLPSHKEWNVMVNYIKGSNDNATTGKKLKATSDWNDYQEASGNGTDNYGFSALPGGYSNSDGSFDHAGEIGYWWSASVYSNNPYYWYMNYNSDSVKSGNIGSEVLFSVRCVKN